MNAPDDTSRLRAEIDHHLGRPPQDSLEAAVVLEAWTGRDAVDALPTATTLFTAEGHDLERGPLAVSAEGRPPAPAPDTFALADAGFVLGVLFTGFWASQLADDLGTSTVDRGWRLALPISLGLQWLLRRRLLAGPDGLGRLRHHGRAVLLGTSCLLLALTFVGTGGPLAAALTTIWTGGFVLARRGWGVHFAVALVAEALVLGPLGPHLHAGWLFGLAAGGTATAALLSVWSGPESDRRPGPWGRAVPAAVIGAVLGLLLVLEPRFLWDAAPEIPALTVVPSLLGGLWGGFHMTRLWQILPNSLAQTSIRIRDEALIGRLTRRLLVESLSRLVIGAGAASIAVLVFVKVSDSDAPTSVVRSLLLAHAVLALTGLLIGLLEAFGRWGWALASALVGCAAAFRAEALIGSSLTPGARILIGAALAGLCAAGPLVRLLHEPDRNVAAAL